MSFLDESELNELNDVWRNLLGTHDSDAGQSLEQSVEPPVAVVADPWRELLQAQGIELVDLQQHRSLKVQVSFSEQEVEQALQYLQEQ